MSKNKLVPYHKINYDFHQIWMHSDIYLDIQVPYSSRVDQAVWLSSQTAAEMPKQRQLILNILWNMSNSNVM